MPKFSKGFGRRKSTPNVIEELQESPAVEHSFKVFERHEGGSKSFDGGVKLAKTTPVGRPKTSQKAEENMFEHLNSNRGSGASNTNTASTTDNSSRLSAASTAPSSTDISGRDEWRSGHDKPFNNIPVPPIPKSSSGFSLKSAGRSLSWGRNNSKGSTSPPKELPALPVDQDSPPGRVRAVTSSSYASTATPPKLDDRDLDLSTGGSFGDMFKGLDKRKSAVLLQQENSRAMSQSPESLPPGPASRSYSSNHYNHLSPLNIDKSKDVEASPYSWSSQHSQVGLMSNSTPPIVPRNEDPPPPPRHTSPTSTRQQQTNAVTDTGLRRSSGIRRHSTLDYDEDARLLRESVNASRKLNEPSYIPRVRDSWALPSDKSYKVDETTISSWGMGSSEVTPKARKPVPSTTQPQEDVLFDSHIAASASLAQRFQEQASSPTPTYTPRNKVMTPAQFERYKQDQERLSRVGGQPKEEDEDEDDEHYNEVDDDEEKQKQLAKLRRKQEAHMSVYRQQMMKVTGEAASAGPSRPPMAFASQSTPNLVSLGKPEDGEEEDEEVPLAILQAHGFPSKSKPPIRSMGSNPNLRAQSVVGGADGRLPVFARNLPQDPYLGAGLVNHAHRESLSFGGGAGSVTGAAPSRGLPPGGLVGVIATEERSRAMRRGSPNAQGEYGPIPPPSNGFNGMGMPPNPAMMNGMGPMGMNPMMMTPGDQAQIQMSQQMQQFMQMQMQFMQMMTSSQGPQQNGTPQQPSGQLHMPGSPSLAAASSHQRAMTMDNNSAAWLPQSSYFPPSIRNSGAGYAPSIAPSERSNIGLPGRYRPVSHAPLQDNKSRASTMSGALQGWESKNGSSTIKQLKTSGNVSDEDDEEGWEEMAKNREKKKSTWKTKRDTNGFKDLLGFAQT